MLCFMNAMFHDPYFIAELLKKEDNCEAKNIVVEIVSGKMGVI